MATAYDCKFIETSVGINHNVDELLVGLLTQIRLKLENPEKSRFVLYSHLAIHKLYICSLSTAQSMCWYVQISFSYFSFFFAFFSHFSSFYGVNSLCATIYCTLIRLDVVENVAEIKAYMLRVCQSTLKVQLLANGTFSTCHSHRTVD